MPLVSRLPKAAPAKAPTVKIDVDRYRRIRSKKISWAFNALLFSGFTLLVAGCGTLPKEAADAQSQAQRGEGRQGATPVEVAIARTGKLASNIEYTGTTEPLKTVSVRPQVEGQLLNLNVDVGDIVKQGQILAQLDDTLLRTEVNEAQAELASRQSEVTRARTQVSNARAAVEQARLELQQAQADSGRQQSLLREGAIAAQQAEQARTQAQTSAQVLRAAQDQVRTEQQAVAAAQGQVNSQAAVVAQTQKRRSYARLISPINGVVLEKITEPGNLVQPGSEILKLGDFSRVQVVAQVSELELSKIRVGQSAGVRLDAFPNQTLVGQVTRISPAADRTARLIPVKVIIPNSNRQIGSGLLARINFAGGEEEQVVVPQSAVVQQGSRGQGDKGTRGQGEDTAVRIFPPPVQVSVDKGTGGAEEEENRNGTVFVVNREGAGGTAATVIARSVTLGERVDGKVEILSGLRAGERFVAKSGKPLKNGETVSLSVLSEKPQQQEQR